MKRLIFLALFFASCAQAGGETSSPNMGLVVPGVGVTAGPDWANDINTSLGVIDQHDHSPGHGVQVTPAGINISSDLSFNDTNVSLPRSIRYTSQSGPISTANDLSCSYVSNGDLYFNDGNGNQIRITQGGSVSGSAGTITGLPSGTASAAFSPSQGTFVFQQATSTAANMDIGTLLLRYPGSYPTPAGNYIALQAPTSLATGYAFTLPNSTPGSAGSYLTSDTSGNWSYTTPDGVASAMTATGADTIANSRTRATGTTVAVGGVAIASSSGNFSTTSTSFATVTNQSLTITTSGRPVFVAVVPDGTGTPVDFGGQLFCTSGGGCAFAILRGATLVGTATLGAGISAPIAITSIDPAAAGTYTYTLKAKILTGSTAEVQYAHMVAYEL